MIQMHYSAFIKEIIRTLKIESSKNEYLDINLICTFDAYISFLGLP